MVLDSMGCPAWRTDNLRDLCDIGEMLREITMPIPQHEHETGLMSSLVHPKWMNSLIRNNSDSSTASFKIFDGFDVVIGGHFNRFDAVRLLSAKI